MISLVLSLAAFGLVAAPASAMNPMHLKYCEAQLLGLEEPAIVRTDYTTVHVEPGTDLPTLFMRLFYTDISVAEYCGATIKAFMTFARDRGVDLSQAEVLYLTNPKTGLNAKSARGLRERFWSFHVIAAYQGKILDFSYGNTPRVVEAGEYFEKMFAADPNTMVELVPSRAYLSHSDGVVPLARAYERIPFADYVAAQRR